jgi:iron(III) transport system substrate-binding protein
MSRFLVLGLLAGVAVLSLAGLPGCGGGNQVVLYCAQDKEFADEVLPLFTQQTGLAVAPKFDTEADKSVSLYLELVNEKARPRCDVFWNNEIVSTIRLQKLGLLEAYASPSAEAYPAFCKAKDASWHAFAARARVLIVHTGLVPAAERPHSLLDLTQPRWRGKVVMAKPQFGTTATQAACLFEVLGPDRARDFYRGLKANEVRIVAGNKHVAELVGQGQAAVGLTDTDDALAEVRAGRPVAILYPDRAGHPDHPRLGTLFIPNTLALIKRGPRPEAGKQLIDFLLSAEVEKRLAEGPGHQIPLNPNVHATLPPELETPRTVQAMQVDFERAAELWDEAQQFLTQEFAR